MTTQSPNVRKLICHRVAQLMIPAGGGLADGVSAILQPGKLTRAAREATDFVNESIRAVKAAPDNPWGDDDEAIAGEILRRLQQRATGE